MAIALSGSLILSGSITVSGSIISTGTISMSGSIASASYANNATTASYALNATTGAYANTATSASYALNATTFNGLASSIFATTGSNTFIGTQTITGSVLQSGSFTTTGTIIAQTINVQQVTSSIVYSCGSNIFGTNISNTQQLTGSVGITGSLTIAGASSATSYNGATIFGSTIACSPIGCFATSCATSFIGGTMSGTTIYGSTAVCSPVGKFTSCIDAGSGTFSGILNVNAGASATSTNICSNGDFVSNWIGNCTLQLFSIRNNTSVGVYLNTQNSSPLILGVSTGTTGGTVVNHLSISSTGTATFACSVTQLGEQLLVSNAGSPNIQLRKSGVTDWGSMTYTGALLQLGTYAGGQTLNITTGGSVGIGTGSPSAKLNIFGTAGCATVTPQETLVHIGGNELGNNGGYAGIRLGGAGDATNYGVYIRGVKQGGYGAYWDTALTFNVTRTSTATTIDEAMRITSDSKVGIGCTSPNRTLTVNGNIGMPSSYNWGVINDNDTNWGFKVCTSSGNYSTFLSYAGDLGSDRRGGIYNQNGHWVAYGNCAGHFVVQCNLYTSGTTCTSKIGYNGYNGVTGYDLLGHFDAACTAIATLSGENAYTRVVAHIEWVTNYALAGTQMTMGYTIVDTRRGNSNTIWVNCACTILAYGDSPSNPTFAWSNGVLSVSVPGSHGLSARFRITTYAATLTPNI